MSSGEIILSVIIPCYNDGRFLLDAIDSARSNHRGFHEIIIVNDGSSDPQTLQVLHGLHGSDVQIIDQPNKGLGAARNRGVSAARGRYILPLDADNRIRPEYIDRGISVLDQEPEVEVVYGDAEYFGSKTGRWYVHEFSLSKLLQANYIDACAVYRKSAWERCGGYDTRIPTQGYEDWDLWLRIACTGGKFRHVPEVLFEYQVRSDSMSTHMTKPSPRDAAWQHIYAKRVEVSIGEYAHQQQSWEFIIERIRWRPFRTMAELLIRAFVPSFYTQLVKWRGKCKTN